MPRRRTSFYGYRKWPKMQSRRSAKPDVHLEVGQLSPAPWRHQHRSTNRSDVEIQSEWPFDIRAEGPPSQYQKFKCV